MDPPTPSEARRLLAEAARAQDRLGSRGGWIRRYLLVFAAAALVVFPLIGLGGTTGSAVAVGGWLALVSLMSWWASRQTATERGGSRRNLAGFVVWGALYGLGLLLGFELFPGEPLYWLPAAVVVAAPLALAALVPARR